jgi:uncharacterized coiled-coil DUF342 family protein
MADLTLDPQRLRAYADRLQADIDSLHAEISDMDNAIDEKRREVIMLEGRLKAVRERLGIGEAGDGN